MMFSFIKLQSISCAMMFLIRFLITLLKKYINEKEKQCSKLINNASHVVGPKMFKLLIMKNHLRQNVRLYDIINLWSQVSNVDNNHIFFCV